jgi:hypothetical protein
MLLEKVPSRISGILKRFGILERIDAIHGVLALSASGAIAALGFALLTSNRLLFVDAHVVVGIVVFIQWQLFSVTAAKFGLDQIAYVYSSNNNAVEIDLLYVFIRVVFPLTVVIAMFVWMLTTPILAVLILLSVISDSLSIIVIGDLNGRGDHFRVAKGNLLHYPVYFIVLILAEIAWDMSLEQCLSLFVASSWLRFLYVVRVKIKRQENLALQRPQAVLKLGLQQISNYILFRGDQLLISAIAFGAISSVWMTREISQYLYYAKFYDLTSAVLTVIGVVVFKSLYLVPGELNDGLRTVARKGKGIAAIGALLTLLALLVYWSFYNGKLSLWGTLSFFFMIALVFPANFLSVSMIRAGAVGMLLRNQCLAILLGFVVAVTIVTLEWPIWYLPIVVIAQLALFLILNIYFPWKTKSNSLG